MLLQHLVAALKTKKYFSNFNQISQKFRFIIFANFFHIFTLILLLLIIIFSKLIPDKQEPSMKINGVVLPKKMREQVDVLTAMIVQNIDRGLISIINDWGLKDENIQIKLKKMLILRIIQKLQATD